MTHKGLIIEKDRHQEENTDITRANPLRLEKLTEDKMNMQFIQPCSLGIVGWIYLMSASPTFSWSYRTLKRSKTVSKTARNCKCSG